MLRSMNNLTSARKLCGNVPMLSRLQPRQSCVSILYINHYPSDIQIATFTRTPVNFKYADPKEREPCPVPPPPPPPPPKDDRIFWGTLAVIVGAAGFAVYAKNNPEVRDWLTINASWFDEIIAIMYEENMTYREFATACIDDTKRFLEKFKQEDTKPKECSTGGAHVKDCPPVPPKEKEVPEVCNPPPPEICKKSICEVEKCMIELSDCAINNYDTAKSACAYYNKLVQETMESFTFRGMKELRPAMEERLKLVETSLKNAANCLDKVEALARYVDCGVRASKEQINNTKLLYQDYSLKFKASLTAYQWENDKSIVMDKQWQIVEAIIDKYTAENEYMFAGLKYCSQKPHITGDLDALFTNSYRYIKELEGQLNEASGLMTERVNRAIEDLPQKKSPAFVQALTRAIKQKGGYTAKEFKRREADQKARNDKFLKDSIKKQNDLHTKSLAVKLVEIEEQVRTKFNKMVAEKVASEKAGYAKELKLMAAKLKIVEDKLEARLKAERETRRSQELWAAGASLLQATKKGDPYVKVDRELNAIQKASGGDDKLVLTVLKSIPASVREKGIVPESVLRDRFRTMEKTARSVALIEQEGAPMHVYMLSWLQGLLLFMKIRGIPQKEFEKPPLEPPDGLDTFDLLQRARFWIERGNLAVAVRYVESLKGASRAAADKWFEEARAHLEVRQAAEAVLAHAASLGLRYI